MTKNVVPDIFVLPIDTKNRVNNMKFLLASLIASVALASPQGVVTNTSVTVTTGSTLALAANPYRGYLLVQNNGSGSCQLKFGSAITGSEGVVLGASQNYEVINGYVKSSVYMKCTQSCAIAIVETNY